MGGDSVSGSDPGERRQDSHPLRDFTRQLLEDLTVLDRMLDSGMIESDVRRIGAEQEMFLVDRHMQPATTALEILEKFDHPQLSPELGLFNLEVNLEPRTFGDDCLWQMEQEIEEMVARLSRTARTLGTRILLTGILPTLKQRDLTLDAMTPVRRYRELNRCMFEHRGGVFPVHIKGLDELNVTHDNVMCEACNTSFQIHFQVGAEEFPLLYNLAQLITAPVLAAAANSPLFLQHRLWHESRVALFQQAIDSRSDAHRARRVRPRVIFGDRWIKRSVLEVYRDDVARFPPFLFGETFPSSKALLDEGTPPRLEALCRHNGTVYRWNRPCYGVRDGVPHLRIEHRALPAGPTVVDEVANAAFFYGLMSALSEEYKQVDTMMAFDDVKGNFTAAARYGLKARFQWVDGHTHAADSLILEHLLPLAHAGLKSKEIRGTDIDGYLGVIENRVRSGQTGAQWTLDTLATAERKGRAEERFTALTECMYERFLEGRPVHQWKPASLNTDESWLESYRTVEQVMTTDLFTVREDDLIDLAANLMDWEHIRHVPVEDQDGRLVGLVTHRQLLRLIGRGNSESVSVREIMRREPVSVTADTTTLTAIAHMRSFGVSCLPVVGEQNKLVGIISERDFIHVSARLLDEALQKLDTDAT